eukprot:SAG22_NODE_3310_length_1788_cov_1.157490_3_plen_50_part_01
MLDEYMTQSPKSAAEHATSISAAVVAHTKAVASPHSPQEPVSSRAARGA